MIPLSFVFVIILTSFSNFADSLYNIGDYHSALIEYERLDFLSPGNKWKFKKGLCYRKLCKFNEAIAIFTLINEQREIVNTYIISGDYTVADVECRRLGNLELLGWIKLLERKWDESATLFNQIGKAEIARDILGKKIQTKDVKKAQVLSTILPGVGEMYAGNPSSGLFTLSLNLLFGWLSMKSFIDDRPLDGVLITFFLWNRFYQGGIENAEKSASRYNKQKEDTFIKHIETKYGFELEDGYHEDYRE